MGSICCKAAEEAAAPVPPKRTKCGSKNGTKAEKLQEAEENPGHVRERIYASILLTAHRALSFFEGFGEAFAQDRFNTDLQTHHQEWIDQRYSWFLPVEDVSFQV